MGLKGGQVTLSFVLLVGGILVVIGTTLLIFALSAIQSAYAFEAANRALAVATGGAEDALLRLVRNKDFSAPSGYNLPLGSFTATVTVTQNSPASGEVTIISYAKVSRSERRLQVIASVSSSTGEISLRRWQQL